MKKVYYLCHCGSGTSVHMKLLDLVREEKDKFIFHIKDFDWDLDKSRVITLKVYKEKRIDHKGDVVDTLQLRSSKEQYKFSFIREYEINDDEAPEKIKIEF